MKMNEGIVVAYKRWWFSKFRITFALETQLSSSSENIVSLEQTWSRLSFDCSMLAKLTNAAAIFRIDTAQSIGCWPLNSTRYELESNARHRFVSPCGQRSIANLQGSSLLLFVEYQLISFFSIWSVYANLLQMHGCQRNVVELTLGWIDGRAKLSPVGQEM